MALPNFPNLVYRSEKGVDLTPNEVDQNFRTGKNYSIMLAGLFGVALNPDGTLNANSVNTAAIQDGAVTQAKIDTDSLLKIPLLGVDTGVANAYAATYTATPVALLDGMSFLLYAGATNTAASTFTVNALAPVTIRKAGDVELTGGEIQGDSLVLLTYNDGHFRMISLPIIPTAPQSVEASTTNYSTSTTPIPFDNTIPQNTEGDELLTVTITPKSTTSKLVIDMQVPCANASASTYRAAALFQDTNVNALAAACDYSPDASTMQVLAFTHVMTAGTLVATTFKLRVGPVTATTLHINGNGVPGRIFGGVSEAWLRVIEIPA